MDSRRVESMAKLNMRGQAERCRRLARDSTDLALRDRLPKLAENTPPALGKTTIPRLHRPDRTIGTTPDWFAAVALDAAKS